MDFKQLSRVRGMAHGLMALIFVTALSGMFTVHDLHVNNTLILLTVQNLHVNNTLILLNVHVNNTLILLSVHNLHVNNTDTVNCT